MIEVKPIDRYITKKWLIEKHYAKRMCSISYSFGAYIGELIVGIVTYGPPASPQVGRGFLGEEHRAKVIELNRLCVNDSAPANTSSILVGRSLRLMKDYAVVSYADGRMGHVGYIYQATNFIYCGAKKSHDCEYLVDGNWVHPRTLSGKGITSPGAWAKENGIPKRLPEPKHRYIYFANKRLRKFLKYIPEPYPKGKTSRYASMDILGCMDNGQKSLF